MCYSNTSLFTNYLINKNIYNKNSSLKYQTYEIFLEKYHYKYIAAKLFSLLDYAAFYQFALLRIQTWKTKQTHWSENMIQIF